MNGKHPERFNDMSIEEYAMRRERKLAQTAAERAAELTGGAGGFVEDGG